MSKAKKGITYVEHVNHVFKPPNNKYIKFDFFLGIKIKLMRKLYNKRYSMFLVIRKK